MKTTGLVTYSSLYSGSRLAEVLKNDLSNSDVRRKNRIAQSRVKLSQTFDTFPDTLVCITFYHL